MPPAQRDQAAAEGPHREEAVPNPAPPGLLHLPGQLSPLHALSSGGLGGCRCKGRKVCPRERCGRRAASLAGSSPRDCSHECSWIGREGAEEVVQGRGRTDRFVQQKQEEKVAERRGSQVRVQFKFVLESPIGSHLFPASSCSVTMSIKPFCSGRKLKSPQCYSTGSAFEQPGC